MGERKRREEAKRTEGWDETGAIKCRVVSVYVIEIYTRVLEDNFFGNGFVVSPDAGSRSQFNETPWKGRKLS